MNIAPQFVRLFAGAGVFFFVGSCFAQEQEAQEQRIGAILSVARLQELREVQDLRIVEVGRDRSQYDMGHLPDAIFVDWVADIIDQKKLERYNVIGPTEMEDLLGHLGITPETTVVLYDDLSSRLSTRMYWSMRFYGHKRVHVLDGGRAAWARSGRAFSQAVPTIAATKYEIREVDLSQRVDMAYIESHLGDPSVQLIDGRPPEQFTGEQVGKVFHTGKAHANRGHVPGAVNVYWKDNFNEDGTFKSIESLRRLYRKSGVKSGTTVITYCNEGLHAAPPWFVLKELLGFDDVRVYDDSMSEWANEAKPMSEK